jgi:DNA-binding NarL/FixJ family response regulator
MENRILIVDDEVDFVRSLQGMLETKSFHVLTACNRAQAELLAKLHKPDLAIIGTIIPRGDAFLLHLWLRQTPGLSDAPILVIDARPEEELTRGWRRDEGMRCEAEDYLTKPVEPAALMPRIEKLLDRATRKIRVLVVDDHAVVREGIRAMLSLQRDIQVVGDANNGKEAVEKAIELCPDVVLMDIVMPIMDGLEATRRIGKECPHARVLILTQYDDEKNVRDSAQAGAMGFILKTALSSRLLNGIRSLSQGKRFIENHADEYHSARLGTAPVKTNAAL